MCSVPIDDIKLHPGVEVALKRHEMDEGQLARALAAGDISGPIKFFNSWFFNLRITGVGAAYREQYKEYVWRDPALYMNQGFLDRCNGLPVIIEHPEKMMLDGREYRERNIGSIIYPYLRMDVNEVWGIARILDMDAAEYMQTHQISTSPAVVFRSSTENTSEELKNGHHLLIEGKPNLIDHLAICEEGVWDKAGKPTGVDLTGEREMPDMDTEMDKRGDAADFGEKLDKLLTGIDSLSKRMDAYEARDTHRDDAKGDDTDKETEERQAAELRELAAEEEKEAEEAEGAAQDAARLDDAKKRHDAARVKFDDAHKRHDAKMSEEDKAKHDASHKKFDDAGKKLDDAIKARDDKMRDDRARDDARRRGDEEEMPYEEGERKEGESDSAYSKRMDDMSGKHDSAKHLKKRDDESTAAHCDRAAKDMRGARARRDAEKAVEEAEAKASEAKADAKAAREDAAQTRTLLEEIRMQIAPRPYEDEAKFADAQSRADAVFMAFGERAPVSMRGESLTAYEIRLARGLQKHSKTWKDEDLSKLAHASTSAFDNAKVAIYADAQIASREPSAVVGGGLRKIIKHREGGGEMYEWAGDPKEWMGHFMPAEVFATRLGKE